MEKKFWTRDRIRFVEARLHLSNNELAELIATTFGYRITPGAMRMMIYRKGLKRSREQIDAILRRSAHKGGLAAAALDRSGSKNPNWKGGISQNHYRYKKRQMKRFPKRVAARQKVQKALASGDITRQACEVCGEPSAEAHHDDYTKPLEVRWLCKKHHTELHMETGTWGRAAA